MRNFKFFNLLLVMVFTTLIYSCSSTSKEDLDTRIRIVITPGSLDLSNVSGDAANCKNVSAQVYHKDELKTDAKVEFSIDKADIATVESSGANSAKVCGVVNAIGLANLVVKGTLNDGTSSTATATVTVNTPGATEVKPDESRAIRIDVTPVSIFLGTKEEATKCTSVSASLIINGEVQKDNEVKLSVEDDKIATLDTAKKELCGKAQGFTNLVASATYQDKEGKDTTITQNTQIIVSDGAIEKDAINFSYSYPDAKNRKKVEFIAELPNTEEYQNATLSWTAKNVVSSGSEEDVTNFKFKDNRFIYTFNPKLEGSQSQDTFKVSLTVTKKGSVQETITKTIYVSNELPVNPINLNFTYKEIGNGWVEFYVNIKDKNIKINDLNFQVTDEAHSGYTGLSEGKNVVYAQFFKESGTAWTPNRSIELMVYSNDSNYEETVISTINVTKPADSQSADKPASTTGEKITLTSSERAFRTTLTATKGANDRFESFEWAFGDGTIITDKNVSPTQEHIYARPGNYEVTLLAKAYATGQCPTNSCPKDSQISKHMVRIAEDKTFINKLNKPAKDEVYIAFYITGISASNKFKDPVKNEYAFPRTVDLMFENENDILLFGATKDKYKVEDLAYKAGYTTEHGYGDKDGKTLQVPYYIANGKIKASRSNPVFSFRNFAIVDPTKSLLGAHDFDRISFIRMNEAARLTFNVDFSKYNPATDHVALFEVSCVASKDNPKKPCVTKFIKFDKIDK